MRLSILGPLDVGGGNGPVPVGPFKQQVVLGLLACRANRTVPVSGLSEALWDGAPPQTAHKNLQGYVSAIRRLLVADTDGSDDTMRLLHSPPGYVLCVGPSQLDALHFHDLVQAGRRACRGGQAATAADLLGQAIRMWRDDVLPELSSVAAIAVEAKHLREQYLAAYEDWAEAKLALGHHADLLGCLDELASRYPFRERLRQAQMLALYRCGRQTEALAQFDGLRQLLAHELGLRPSPVLKRLYESILLGDRSLESAALGQLAPTAVRTITTGHSRLTRDIADFTGRRRQVGDLIGILTTATDGTLTALSGAVAVGKTALAVHCAHQVSTRFPDGRILASLRSADGSACGVAELLADLLHGMRLADSLPETPAGRAALLRDATSGRRMLFILDDAVTEEQVREVVAALGDVNLVVTSRRRLVGLESATQITVEPMTGDEALQMLTRLVGPVRVAAEPQAAQRLAALCGGLPLLIRIVGAKLNGLRHLSLARYAERLLGCERLLDHLTAGNLEIRSRLAISYRELTPDDRAMLRRLAFLPDSIFTAADAASSLGTDAITAEAAIEQLMDVYLVTACASEADARGTDGAIRYALPWPVRAFVWEQEPSTG